MGRKKASTKSTSSFSGKKEKVQKNSGNEGNSGSNTEKRRRAKDKIEKQNGGLLKAKEKNDNGKKLARNTKKVVLKETERKQKNSNVTVNRKVAKKGVTKGERQTRRMIIKDDKIKNENIKEEVEDIEENTDVVTKAENESFKNESDPPKKVGAHVSISGGLHKAVENALELGAKAFGLFLRNQRQWASKPLTDEDADKFREACKHANFSPNQILPHGIYLMNCASPDEDSLTKSRDTLVDELKRCEKLGLMLYNFHPGSTCGKISVDEGVEKIAHSINIAHKETKFVVTLIENMCCQGHTIGGKFEELKAIIDKVEDKTRVGVCFDTCHAFAAGYDITGKETLDHTMDLFDKIIGINYLKAVHLNDSKGECGCHLDRHENIGKGKIGIKGFTALMNDARFNGIPMILETPECDYSKEIAKLYSLAEH